MNPLEGGSSRAHLFALDDAYVVPVTVGGTLRSPPVILGHDSRPCAVGPRVSSWVRLARGTTSMQHAVSLTVPGSTLEQSIPPSLMQLLESQQDAHDLPTKHAVIVDASVALERSELERAYAGAALDVDATWDETTTNGLTEFQDENE